MATLKSTTRDLHIATFRQFKELTDPTKRSLSSRLENVETAVLSLSFGLHELEDLSLLSVRNEKVCRSKKTQLALKDMHVPFAILNTAPLVSQGPVVHSAVPEVLDEAMRHDGPKIGSYLSMGFTSAAAGVVEARRAKGKGILSRLGRKMAERSVLTLCYIVAGFAACWQCVRHPIRFICALAKLFGALARPKRLKSVFSNDLLPLLFGRDPARLKRVLNDSEVALSDMVTLLMSTDYLNDKSSESSQMPKQSPKPAAPSTVVPCPTPAVSSPLQHSHMPEESEASEAPLTPTASPTADRGSRDLSGVLQWGLSLGAIAALVAVVRYQGLIIEGFIAAYRECAQVVQSVIKRV
eukprot:gnl/Dysnectes_brevis/7754_a13314_258.p1 GENE.gnl/Dysnectes_brevis/7754_a13314_258~~gnl/Dysnectes_brevis/7754_a13314_258.p1  ORF type:complete len:411 (-),score=51.06 gnl/Dysnectes_brevis/7754_a13314_258:14-1072(-)